MKHLIAVFFNDLPWYSFKDTEWTVLKSQKKKSSFEEKEMEGM